LRADEVTQTGSYRHTIAEVMVAIDGLIPERPVLRSFDQCEGERLEISDTPGDFRLWRAGGGVSDTPGTARPRPPHFRQLQPTTVTESLEQLATLVVLQATAWAFPVEEFTNGAGDLGDAERRAVGDDLTDQLEVFGREPPATEGQSRNRNGCSPLWRKGGGHDVETLLAGCAQ
jgi:hypothetical protein